MHKTCITDNLILKFWSGVFWSAGRNKRARTVYLIYAFCRLWRLRPFLVCKYCKFFVGFWLCQYGGLFPSLFYNQCCYFWVSICILIILCRFLWVFKFTDMVVPSLFHQVIPNSFLFRYLIWLLLYIWHFQLSTYYWEDIYFLFDNCKVLFIVFCFYVFLIMFLD